MTRLIAEIGQNHSGALTNALDLIRICANPQRHDFYGPDVGGVDAVKMTKRDLAHELTRPAAEKPYTGDKAFGETYGAHREALELTDAEHAEAYHYAKDLGLDFIETICAPEALSLLDRFTPDAIKAASRDLTNHHLLNALAETKLPLILSTGMAGPNQLDAALEVVTRHHEDITILHCLSQYPADADRLNLLTIPWMRDHYADYRIGYSDHSMGVWAPVAATALGAEVIEKHVTLDRMMRGSDHRGSLDRSGVYRWVRNTRMTERALGQYTMKADEAVAPAREKLARSVATTRTLREGEPVTEDDIEPLSPGSGIPWPERETVVGSITIQDVPEKELLTATMVA